jgi:hypothetical protein
MTDPSTPSPRARIMIATPCFGGLLTQGYVESLIRLIHHAAASGVELHLALLGHDALITRSRNTLVANFLDRPELTHLMFIDADIAYEPEAVTKLLDFDEDLVAGVYPLKVSDWEGSEARRQFGETPALSALEYVGTLSPCGLERRGDFATAVYAGTGFMMIKRRVLEILAAAHPELHYRGAHVYPPPDRPSGNQVALFDCMIEPETRTYLSEDYAFCRRWLDQGGKIWLDTCSRLGHIGAHQFMGDTSLRLADLAVQQARASLG